MWLLKKEKIKFIEYNRGYIDYAKENRKNSTKVERIFWWMVKTRKFLWYKFRRQKVIWPFILDFYCSELLLWIELDGWYHNNRIDYDRYRDSKISKKWIRVVRFRNEDIEKNIEDIAIIIVRNYNYENRIKYDINYSDGKYKKNY